MKPYKLSASLICGNPLSLEGDIKSLVAGGIDAIHFDVMDGIFVPRYGLYPEYLRVVRSITDLPIDVHMMCEDPTRHIKTFTEAGASIICVHAEACKHLHYTLKTIRENGVRAGIALNYSTPLNILDYITDDVDMVMLMAINPGIVGHKMIPGIFKKIKDLRKRIDESGRDISIAIDGGVNPDSVGNMINAGADFLICGTSAIFKPNVSLEIKIKEFREIINSHKHV